MRPQIEQLVETARKDMDSTIALEALRDVRARYLGRKGQLTGLLRSVRELGPDERPAAGKMANEARAQIEAMLDERERELADRERAQRTGLDITLPGRRPQQGVRHPIEATREEIERCFLHMGFSIADGPEVETDELNFECLNITADHPARDMQDTFFVGSDLVLRTHTSPVQIRYMRQHAPRIPVRIIAPGRVYRRDDDATHSPMFSQIEGLVIDRHITLGDLKGTLELFARELFGPQTTIRLRPSYFPFTEPSAELDVSCTVCGGGGCRTCSGTGWLEILGAGMVHPQVLRNGGYDPDSVTGFAFGMGIERVAMLRHGISDLRLLFDNDLRFLRQVGGGW